MRSLAQQSKVKFSDAQDYHVFSANILLLQLPCILLTGTTFHGYLSGNKYSVIKAR